MSRPPPWARLGHGPNFHHRPLARSELPQVLERPGGQAASQYGAQITKLALPVLAVLMLRADEAQVGYLNASGLAAFLLVGLPAGAWIDRMRKRRVMILADGVRAIALATIPLLYATGLLELWHLYLISLIQGTASVFFDVSYQSVVPALVAGERIAEAVKNYIG